VRMNSHLLIPALTGLLAALAYEGHALYRAERHNLLVADPARIEIDDATPPALVFARAYERAEAGDRTEALRLYGTILHRGDETLRARVHYNLGTLYLQEAARLWNAQGVLEYIRVNTLLGEAKEHLGEALRLAPDDWDARYNLEYAHRITPPPKEPPKSDFKGTKNSVFATLPTIPGGGP
jgi:mxaK protein